MLLQTSSLYLQRMYVKGTNDKGEEVVEGISEYSRSIFGLNKKFRRFASYHFFFAN